MFVAVIAMVVLAVALALFVTSAVACCAFHKSNELYPRGSL